MKKLALLFKKINLNRNNFVILLLSFYLFVLASGFVGNFKLLFVFSFAISIAIFYLLENLFFSFFLTSLTSMAIFIPNKYYTIEVIKGSEIFLPEFRSGYFLGYGLNISNVLLLFSSMFLAYFLYLHRSTVSSIIKKNMSLFILCSSGWLVFFLVSLFSSMYISFSPELSTIWLIQYMQFLLIAIGVIVSYFLGREKFQLILKVVALSMLFQFFIGVTQFILQSHIGLVIEQSRGGAFYTGLDENNAIFRIDGTFMYSNQLALVSIILFSILAPALILYNNSFIFASGLATIVIILFTQSRIIWLALCLLLIMTIKIYSRPIATLMARAYSSFNLGKVILILLISSIFLFTTLPRIQKSVNFFADGSGGKLRYKMIIEGLEALTASPWIGYGVGTNEYVLHKLFPEGIMSIFPAAIHFGFLQMLLEFGCLGLLGLLFPFLVILRTILTTKRTKKYLNRELTEYRYIYLSGTMSAVLYYSIQPHVGIVEFPYIGLIVGFGLLYSILIRGDHHA